MAKWAESKSCLLSLTTSNSSFIMWYLKDASIPFLVEVLFSLLLITLQNKKYINRAQTDFIVYWLSQQLGFNQYLNQKWDQNVLRISHNERRIWYCQWQQTPFTFSSFCHKLSLIPFLNNERTYWSTFSSFFLSTF